MKVRVPLAIAMLGLSSGCGPVDVTASVSAPINLCPTHPCSAYQQSGTTPAACAAGACVVDGATAGLVLVVALPEDSGFAPGQTFLLDYNQLAPPQASPTPTLAACVTPTCAALPGFVATQGQYVILPNLEQPPPLGVGWDLGNPMDTALPISASFRAMWPLTGGATAVDAESLGLPVSPVQASYSVASFGIPGPGAGPSIFFQTYLQIGAYTRILVPSPPFDQAFAPEVKVVTVDATGTTVEDFVDSFDSTQETGQGPTIPTFDITSANGPLDGWTAYLRDGSNQIISNVVGLHGTSSPNVVLATNHVAPGVDALSNAELVVAPPPGTPMPTAVFAPVGNVLPVGELYPALLPPVTVTGRVAGLDGSPVAADLIFEALAVTGANSISYTSNFEFVGWASARPPAASADSIYSVVLPQGRYRVSVRPLDTAHQVTIVDPFIVGVDGAPAGGGNFAVDALRSLTGTATVADGRALAQATIEASPVGCIDGTSVWCLPRASQGVSDVNGLFQLALDPGRYVLRIEPAQGSHLPWVVEPLSVPVTSVATVSSVKVPAGTSVGLSLFDPNGNPIVHALVRAFLLPAQGSAVELGSALTAADGQYDMYLVLPSQ